ncbi:MAG: hypothetical protein H3C31_13170 [Brumimicrobium sp.]|nr:hypothetical protein [Brumimicrobium sp.]
MKKLIYGGLFLALVGVTISGCKKEEVNTPIKSNIPKFSNYEALFEEMNKLNAMDENERRKFEKVNGYKSLYTHVHEVYEVVNMEELKDIEVLDNHVSENSTILEIIKNDLGEREYRPKYSDNPFSILTTSNRLLIVGEKCLKVFDDGLISTDLANINLLDGLSACKLADVEEHSDLVKSIFDVKTESAPKGNCGTYDIDRATNNRDRTKIEVSRYFHENYIFADCIVRPYKKTLGIWYFAKRTIVGSINASISFIQASVPETLNLVSSTSGYYAYKWHPSNFGGSTFGSYTNDTFDFYNGTGDTPSTSTASVNCQ